MEKKILVVGAGGFVGGFIVAEGLRRGYDVWAGVRATTSRQWLADERIHFIDFDFSDITDISKKITEALGEGEKWDYIIYITFICNIKFIIIIMKKFRY